MLLFLLCLALFLVCSSIVALVVYVSGVLHRMINIVCMMCKCVGCCSCCC